MSKEYKPVETSPSSGQHEIVGPRGGFPRKVRAVAKGEPLPSTPTTNNTYFWVNSAKNKSGMGR